MPNFNTRFLAIILSVFSLTLVSCEYLQPKHATKINLDPVGIAPRDKKVLAPPKLAKDQPPTDVAVHAKSRIYPGNNQFATNIVNQKVIRKSNMPGTYTLNFDDTDLSEVAKTILQDSLGLSYVLSPKVTGSVSLQTTEKLTKDELLPTLEMVLRMNNAALVKDGSIYHIEPVSEALYRSDVTMGNSDAGYQTRVIPIKNVSVTEIATLLKPLVQEKTLLDVDVNRNMLVLSGSNDELARVMDLVRTFDIDLLKGRSFGLFALAHVEPEKMIEELQNIFVSSTGGKGKDNEFFSFLAIDRLNSILAITHQARYLNEIENWIIRLDKVNTESGGGVNVYRVQHVNAVDLADTLNDIFGNGSGTKREKPAKVAPGESSAELSNANGGNNGGGKGGDGIKPTTKSSKSSKSSGSGQTGDQGVANVDNVRIISDEPNNSLIIVATPQEYQIIHPIIEQLDVMPLQVLIDATIVEVTLDNQLEYGLKWAFDSGKFAGLLTGAPSVTETGFADGIIQGASLFYSSGTVRAVLKALSDKSLINVIASPSIMVLNNQEGFINVGDKVPIATSQSTNTNSVNTTPTLLGNNNTSSVVANNIQMVETGIILKITPRVNEGGLVIMDLQQEANQAVKTTTSSLDSPTIQQRKINSSIAVKSGETVILGGLIRDDTAEGVTGIPFLSDLPIIGPLFGTTTRGNKRTELVILITPRVVQSSQDARDVTSDFKSKLKGLYSSSNRN